MNITTEALRARNASYGKNNDAGEVWYSAGVVLFYKVVVCPGVASGMPVVSPEFSIPQPERQKGGAAPRMAHSTVIGGAMA